MKPITIVIAEGYSDWEIAPLAGVGRAFYGADIRFASPDGGSVTSVAGLTIADTDRFEPPTDGVVVVCGGPAFEGDNPPDLSERLRQAKAAGCVIAGICGGTVALARAGLLDQVRHTSNGPGYLDQFAKRLQGRRALCGSTHGPAGWRYHHRRRADAGQLCHGGAGGGRARPGQGGRNTRHAQRGTPGRVRRGRFPITPSRKG